MLPQSRELIYHRCQFITKYFLNHPFKTSSKDAIPKQNEILSSFPSNLEGNEIQFFKDILQSFKSMHNKLLFTKAILLKLNKNMPHSNEFECRLTNIGLQQLNTVLSSLQNDVNTNNDTEMTIEKRQYILDVITILRLPTNKLNSRMCRYKCQYKLYQDIFRLILIGNIQHRKSIIGSLSNRQLLDITNRITTKSKVSSRAEMECIIYNQIPIIQDNYKYYKSRQVHKTPKDSITEFEKDELFINWMNIAEQQIDDKLFDILLISKNVSKSKLILTRYVHQIKFDIDTLSRSVLIKLYNAMNEIMNNPN